MQVNDKDGEEEDVEKKDDEIENVEEDDAKEKENVCLLAWPFAISIEQLLELMYVFGT